MNLVTKIVGRLAHQLKRQAASRLIPQIKDGSNNLVSDPQDINKVFENFYTSLYKSEPPSDTSCMDNFLNDLEFPTIDSELAIDLERPLQIDEIREAIRSMQSGKAPGSDGYGSEFYKTFSDKLAPILLDMFNESLANGSLPQTLSQAVISLLLKKDKDPTECGSYRPISLLNIESKIIAKVLAKRLESTLPLIISEDQTGFITGRHSFFNIRRLLNIVNTSGPSPFPEVIVSLDAEKAFDRVEWGYLFAILHKFGFGGTLISWIRLLYASPLACVSTNYTLPILPTFQGNATGVPAVSTTFCHSD